MHEICDIMGLEYVRSPDEVLSARGTERLALTGTCTTGTSMGFFESESEPESESDSEESDSDSEELDSEESDSEELDSEEQDSDSSDDEGEEDEDEDEEASFLVPLAFTFFA